MKEFKPCRVCQSKKKIPMYLQDLYELGLWKVDSNIKNATAIKNGLNIEMCILNQRGEALI